MADQSPSRRELEELINWLEQTRDQLRAQQAAQISLLIALKEEQCLLEDENKELEEMWLDLEQQVERQEAAINEEMRRRRDFLAQMLTGDNKPCLP